MLPLVDSFAALFFPRRRAVRRGSSINDALDCTLAGSQCTFESPLISIPACLVALCFFFLRSIVTCGLDRTCRSRTRSRSRSRAGRSSHPWVLPIE
jgi:hypothetical protein